jgi:hypothetical protein
MFEKVFLPSHKVERVHIVDILFALVHLALDPVAVEVSEEMVIELCRIRVTFPFSDVKGEKGFVGVRFCILVYAVQMCAQILSKKLVKLFTKKMCSTVALRQRPASLVAAVDCLLRGAKVVDGRVDSPVERQVGLDRLRSQ